MDKEKEELFLDLCNSIYDTLSSKQLREVKELRNANLLISLCKEM